MIQFLVCTILITFEYILRLITSPHKWLTFILFINIFDLILLVAGWFYLILIHMNISNHDKQDPFFYIKLFQYLILIRLFRFFRLCRYVKSLRILSYGIEKAFKHIMSIGFIILFFVFTFGVIIQVIEKNWDRAYVTRLEDLFNIVTISTITVGDAKRVPLSPTGKILCSFLAGIGKQIHIDGNKYIFSRHAPNTATDRVISSSARGEKRILDAKPDSFDVIEVH